MATPNLSNTPSWATPRTGEIREEIRWWEAQNIPWQIVRELRRRSNSVNLGQYATVNVVTDFKNQHEKYRGPLTPWVRAFSNGTGNVVNQTIPTSTYLYKNGQLPVYEGFLLQGGDGFDNAYGYKRQGNVLVEDKAIIGYQANGEPHYIDTKYRTAYWYNNQDNNSQFPQNSVVPPILPPPGITSVQIRTNKDMMSTATIQWKCYGLAQLEYMMPFWLSPKINVFLEFGWNLYNNASLLDLNSEDKCYELILRPEMALEQYYNSFGNYGLITGIISKYNFNTDDGFVYTCNTEIISRQAMYSGFRVDNPTVTDNQDGTTQEYVNLKECLTTYLPFIKQVVEDRANYMDYIIKNADKLLATNKKDAKNKQKSKQVNAVMGVPQDNKKSQLTFYNGKPENRIFIGRYESVYGNYKLPTPPDKVDNAISAAKRAGLGLASYFSQDAEDALTQSYIDTDENGVPSRRDPIEYGSTSDPHFQNRKIISFADKDTDFDVVEDANDEVWFQMDFVFELINLFCSEKKTKNNKIDISDFIVSAHPNLISCDRNVLIPNSIAPKINIGITPGKPVGVGQKRRDGYLDSVDATSNPFLVQYYTRNYDSDIKAGEEIEKNKSTKNKAVNNVDFVAWKAARKAKNTFKTMIAARDDLDSLINKLYYQLGSKKQMSASFPFKEKKVIGTRTYQAYYHGYFKHIYISKSKLVEIGKDGSIKTLQQMVNKILNVINESVDNFWNFEVVENPQGGMAIIDKNLTVPQGTDLYQFDIGSTNGVIKKFNFDVNMTNEQVNQVLYGSGQNAANIANEVAKVAGDTTTTFDQRRTKITQLGRGIPAIAFTDRFESRQLRDKITEKLMKLYEEEKLAQNNPNATTSPPQDNDVVPHGPIVDKNEAIRQLQTHGKQSDDVLVMRIRAVTANENIYGPIVSNDAGKWDIAAKALVSNSGGIDETQSLNQAVFGWVYLNLPSSMKGKLREMLDDGDTKNNTARYAGPADNFTLSLTLDGIMGFRMFQHFSISNLPKPYVPGNVIFMITEVEHQLNAGKWETVVTALLKPANDRLFNYIPI
jgi:hypothetical protein